VKCDCGKRSITFEVARATGGRVPDERIDVNRYRSKPSRFVFALVAISAAVFTMVLMVEVPAKVESTHADPAAIAASKAGPVIPANIVLDPPSAKVVERFTQGDRIDLDCLVLGAWRLRGDSTD
jgi:hypothetical protein